MHALVLLYTNQHTKFEVPSITIFKDMTGAKLKKTGHVTLTTPFWCASRIYKMLALR